MSSELNSLIYLVDDDPDLSVVVQEWLEEEGYDVNCYPDGLSCLTAIAEEECHAICLDLHMPGLPGMSVLKRVHERYPSLPVIVLTSDDSAASAVQAMKLGATDYITKPLNKVRLVNTVKNALSLGLLTRRVSQLEREVEGRGFPGIVGSSLEMKKVFRQMDRLTTSDVSVIIHGESGTGKEIVARSIHDASSRRQGNFVAVNSTAIPETLLESELFGHEKGAFTGAVSRRIGRFEEAHFGTLFLDEIGELSLSVQAKLLRVIQERNFQRVGGTSLVTSDFRLLTATHRNLAEEVRAGRFREDLFFRLAVYELELPPLRARIEDIPILAQTFIRQVQGSGHNKVRGISPSALSVLLQHTWPGNIRELQNVIQRALVMACGPEITPVDLPERLSRIHSEQNEAQEQSTFDSPPPSLEDSARLLLTAAIVKNEGNASATMRELKIGRTRFYRMLKKFNLEDRVKQVRATGA